MIVQGFSFEGRDDEPEVMRAAQLITVDMFCQRYSCLPDSGGLLGQNFQIMKGLELVAFAYARRQELDAKKNVS